MAVVLPSTPALMHIHHHPEKKLRQQQRAEQKMRKESEKYKRHLQKPEVRAAIEESALKREAGKTKPVLSSRIPLDVFIKNRGPLPHSEINPFTNVNCTTAKSNLEKMGFKLESGVGSHFAVRTKAASGHSHGHRLGTLPVHEGETIPPGTHRAIWKEMNDNLIAFLNQAEKSTEILPTEKRMAFRNFVAQKLTDAGAKDASTILPENILSTSSHQVVKSIHSLIEDANPDTVVKVWESRSV